MVFFFWLLHLHLKWAKGRQCQNECVAIQIPLTHLTFSHYWGGE
jgi:hypothetical protein